MLQLARYRGPAVVVAGLLTWLVVVDIALTATVGFTGGWLPNSELPNDTLVFTVTGGKISGILAEPEPVGLGTQKPFGVFLGQSSLGATVESDVVEEQDGLPHRWLNLHGWGSSVTLVREVAELLFLSDLRPNAVIIAINPFMLIGTDFPTQHAFLAEEEGKKIKQWIWVYNNRAPVNHGCRMLLRRIKLGLCRQRILDFRPIYAATPDPWKPSPGRRLPQESAAAQAHRLEHFRKLGWFEPGRYSPETASSHALVELIRESRARGAKVGIILMPEHSALRARIPVEGVRCFAEINRINFRDDPVPLYDLRDRIPDDWFNDVGHPGIDARRPASILVARCVADVLSARPAPERLLADAPGQSANAAPREVAGRHPPGS
jgi:hypothetical protein